MLLLAGCQTAMTPGSLYRSTGNYTDLLAEPTFDIGAGPPEGAFYSFHVPHNDADGHGIFDIPIVFCEQIVFVPTWVCSWMLMLSGSEPYMLQPRPQGPGVPVETGITWTVRKAVGWVVAVPGMATYLASFTVAMGFDTVVHDLPVMIVGFPFRLVELYKSGG